MPVETFDASDTWPCPAGLTSIDLVEVWGGGADGTAGEIEPGDGGGGGAYASIADFPTTPLDDYDVTVGGAGGDSWFSSAVTVLAKGASGTTGGASASCVGDVVFSGGNGASGSGGRGGGGGASAGSGGVGGNGGTPQTHSGGTPPTGGGDGGPGGSGSGLPGGGGSNPGGGGGGGGDFFAANGTGAAGRVRLTYTLPPTGSGNGLLMGVG